METAVRIVRWTLVGFGMTCLLSAVALGVFTATIATRPTCATPRCDELADTASTLAWWSVGAAVVAVVLGVLALAVTAEHLMIRVILRAGLLAAAYALGNAYRWTGFGELQGLLSERLPASQQMWSLLPTVALSVVGLAATALTPHLWRRGFGPLGAVGSAVGIVGAVVLVVTLAVSVLPEGDDSRFISSKTAAAAEIPPWPARLGQQRFEMPLSFRHEDDEDAVPKPAGAGFVAIRARDGDSPVAVVGYDVTGQERWRYARSGPGDLGITDLAVFADGGVVLMRTGGEQPFVTAADGDTGAVLWTSTDDRLMRAAFGEQAWASRSPFLVLRGDEQWTAFDPRSGRQTWEIDDPVRCPNGPQQSMSTFEPGKKPVVVDSATRLTTIVDCSTADRIDLREFSVDPATGTVADRPVPGTDTGGNPLQVMNWYASRIGDNGYVASISWLDKLTPDIDVYVDVTAGRTVQLGETDSMVTGPADGGYLITSGSTVRAYAATGELSCELVLPTTSYVPTTLLGDEVVTLDNAAGRPTVVRVYDRATCRETATLTTSVESSAGGSSNPYLRQMHGVTLLVEPIDGGKAATVFGYS